jgi:cobalt-zinc-cadmium efflux system membrane fusion protein
MKKILLATAVAAALLGSAALVYVRRPAAASEPTAAAPASGADHHGHEEEAGEIELTDDAIARAGIRWEAAQTSAFEQGIEANATVAADPSAVHHVRLAGRGKVQKLLVRLGDTVRAGDPLLVYENHDIVTLQNDLSAARASLNKAEAAAGVAANALERGRNLLDMGALPKAEVERRSVEHRAALSAVEIEKAQVEKTTRLLARAGAAGGDSSLIVQLVSPFSGTITATDVSPGEFRDQTEDVLTITDLSKVWIVADVYERDIASIRRGQRVPVRFDAYAGRDFVSQVASIGDAVEPETRTIKVRCEAANPDRLLKLGMFGKAIVATAVSRQAIVIPAAALQNVAGQPTVYLRTEDGHFQPRTVEPGERRGDRQEIRRGIAAGDPVVVAGAFALKGKAVGGDSHGHSH